MEGKSVPEEDASAESTSASLPKARARMDRTQFPPPAIWYKTNATAARDDMWAYLSTSMIVLVKPKQIQTLIVKPEEQQLPVNDSSDVGGVGKDIWPSFDVFGYQKDPYTCLAFCQSPWDYLPFKGCPLVTGCREGYVRVWDVSSGKCVAYHKQHMDSNDKIHEVAVSCIDWSVRDPSVIYSMDEEGSLCSWYLKKSKLRKFSFGKIVPCSLHVSPHDDNLIAFGTKSGIIYIAQTDPKGNGTCKIVRKVRHDEEIVATLWCPKLNWRLSREAASEEPILASSIKSHKPSTIRIWNKKADDRGIYHVHPKIKDKPYNAKYQNFSPLQWVIDPNDGSPLLLTSSKNGEIVSYSNGSSLNDIVHNIHGHPNIFGLVQCGDILWSTSYEPVIVGWNLRTGMVSCIIPTFKGVCAITPSPSVGSLIGFGGSDGWIRVIDFTKNYPAKSAAKPPGLTFRMKSKIMALAWHPQKDNWLGFGTDDGVLGYYEYRDAFSSHGHAHGVFQFQRRVSGTVYSVDWGPSVSNKESLVDARSEPGDTDTSKDSSLCLYACGGNRVFSVHPSKTDNPLVDVTRIIQLTNPPSKRCGGDVDPDPDSLVVLSKAADIRWSPDFTLFAVGYNDGRVDLHTAPHMELKCWIKSHSRAIQFLNWRPYDFMQMKIDPNHKERWFATASNDSTVRLFNLESIFSEEYLADNQQKPKLIMSSAATLRSPTGGDRIISTSWSPHDPNLLLTVSYDSTAIVWNFRDASQISRYMGHSHRLVACTFHPNNPFQVITSSDELMYDSTLHVWDYRDHPYTEGPASSRRAPTDASVAIHVKGDSRTVEDPDESDNEIAEVGADKKIDASSKKQNSNYLHVEDTTRIADHVSETDSTSGKRAKGRNKRSTSLLPSTANIFINGENTKLLEAEVRYLVKLNSTHLAQAPNVNGNHIPSTNGHGGEESTKMMNVDLPFTHLGLLGDWGLCVNLLRHECESHAQKGDWEKGCLLASWMGDADFIENVVKDGNVNETIIILATHLSRKPHPKACEMYARKLISEEDFGKAATYFVLAGMKEEAIRLLVEHKLFRDAVVLMKLQTLKSSPIRMEVMKKWLIQLMEDGNFEVAAKVYCSMGRFEDALGVIEKRDKAYAWKTGMFLANTCRNSPKLELLGVKLSVDCMVNGRYDEIRQVLQMYDDLQWLLPFIVSHEIVFNFSNKIREVSSMDGEAKEKLIKNFDLRKEIVTKLDIKQYDGKKLKESILVTIAQNITDAEMIMTRSLVLILLGDAELDPSKAMEEALQLCQTWLRDKTEYRGIAYTAAFRSVT